MMPGFTTSKRRAEDFDALLHDGAPTTHDAELAALLDVVSTMRSMPEPVARPAFVADLREQLVAAAASQEVRVVDDAVALRLTPRQKSDSRRERRVATLIGGFAVASATASMAVASQGAMPGDVLYPVKRAIENAQTNLQDDDTSRARSLLSHAEQRLAEVKELQDDDADTDEIASALTALTDQTSDAADLAMRNYESDGDPAGLTDLRDFAGQGAADLALLGASADPSLRGAFVTATQTLRQVDSAAWQACPTCGDSPAEIPDLALMSSSSLSGLLDGRGAALNDLSKQAEKVARNVQRDQGPAKPDTDRPGSRDDDGRTDGTDDPTQGPLDDPTAPLDDIGKKVTDGVKGATDGDPGTSSGSTVVDGVTGLLGTITSPLLP